jgi:DNA adenine methylase
MNDINQFPKPIIKWVGGKTQILDIILEDFPKEIDNYYEIFIGGGSVLIGLLQEIKNKKIKVNEKIHAYDINEPLIFVYKNIQNNHNELYNKIQEIIIEFNNIDIDGEIINRNSTNLEEALTSKESYYYWIRKSYNKLTSEEKKSILGSSYFIFLNKTCFRGLFRVGPNGFNVPYGNYKNPEIINKSHLDEIHLLIKDVLFECCDYKLILNKININFNKNDFIYADPPYAPENEKSFVKYSEHGFNEAEHLKLFEIYNTLNNKKIKLMMSNADVKLVRDNFKLDKFNIKSILCKRSINSKNPESKTNEVIIKNY